MLTALWMKAGNNWVRLAYFLLAITLLLALTSPLIAAILGDAPERLHPELLDFQRGGMADGALGGISWHHPLGVEPGTGRDLFLRLIFGVRTSLFIALASAVIATSIALVVGLLCGYLGGIIDLIFSRISELFMSFPTVYLAIGVVPILDSLMRIGGEHVSNTGRMWSLIMVLSALSWAPMSRIIRGQVLSLRGEGYVEAARSLGASRRHIMFKEIAPNLMSTLLIVVALNIPRYIKTEATLSILGAGMVEPHPSWGALLKSSAPYFSLDPFYPIAMGTTLLIFVLAVNVIGDDVQRRLGRLDR